MVDAHTCLARAPCAMWPHRQIRNDAYKCHQARAAEGLPLLSTIAVIGAVPLDPDTDHRLGRIYQAHFIQEAMLAHVQDKQRLFRQSRGAQAEEPGRLQRLGIQLGGHTAQPKD